MPKYCLPPTLDQDIDKLEEWIAKYKREEISATELKAHRVPFGVYEQRKPNTYMVRIRCAAGCITPSQLERIAELSSKYGIDRIHLTTRQELQIHDVKLDHLIPVIRGLKEAGLASRGGGGNTVRNITAQEDAGITATEIFDVTPFAVSLTTRLIEENDSWTLPRKFKIAFSGSSEDLSYATVADLGFIARVKSGSKGFKVYVAGGLGAKSQIGNLLFDFIPTDEVYRVVKAVKTFFWKCGNRKNKHQARLRFLWTSLGKEEFKRKLMAEYEALRKENPPPLEIEEANPGRVEAGFIPEPIKKKGDFELWKSRFVRPQKQSGFHSITVPVELGFVGKETLKKLAKFLRLFGDDVIRMTKEQNFLVRNIPEKHLANAYNFLKKAWPNFNRPFFCDRILSCAGASTCQLGICLSRGAAQALTAALNGSKMNLDLLSALKINISGCPNACGQHLMADLGFFGKAARKKGRLYPAYHVVAGALVRDGQTRFAESVGQISARDLPAFVKDLLNLYLSKASSYENFSEYIRHEGKEHLKQIGDRYKEIPDFEDEKNYYYDWGAEQLFSVAGRGTGECSAGLFDLIDVDKKNIRETKESLSKIKEGKDVEGKQEYLLKLIFYAARMLLITRGIEPRTEKETFDHFVQQFIASGLVSPAFEEVIRIAKDKDVQAITEKEQSVYELVERVQFLYDHMDNSFQFQVPLPSASQTESAEGLTGVRTNAPKSPSWGTPKIVKDFRGVACPMNFVKTKLELAKLQSKEILEIWLDDGEPIENVPASVKEEGHKILDQKKTGDYWNVTIEKR